MRGCNFFAGTANARQNSGACRVIISFLILILTGTTWGVSESRAQQTSIQGIVTDAVTGQPLEGANILLKNISMEAGRGAATDANGFYQIGNISSGTYYLRFSFVGYRTFEDTLSLSEDGQNEGGQETISVGLQPDQEILNELVIGASGSAAQIEAGYQQIYTSDLGRVPTPAGSGDLASYLQSLPGVVATGDRGGQLYVRGGTPSQNMVLVDGTLIYQPFHILGFFSAFPEDLFASTDFYAGGFGPEYSGRISSVIDVKMRDGNRNSAGGSASLSPFLGELIAEGP